MYALLGDIFKMAVIDKTTIKKRKRSFNFWTVISTVFHKIGHQSTIRNAIFGRIFKDYEMSTFQDGDRRYFDIWKVRALSKRCNDFPNIFEGKHLLRTNRQFCLVWDFEEIKDGGPTILAVDEVRKFSIIS